MSGNFAQIPDDAEPGHDFQRVIGDVNLPPEKALARRSHKVMMVVVPSFSEGEQRQQPIVTAGVRGFVAARPEEGGERVDGKRVMPYMNAAQRYTRNKKMLSA